MAQATNLDEASAKAIHDAVEPLAQLVCQLNALVVHRGAVNGVDVLTIILPASNDSTGAVNLDMVLGGFANLLPYCAVKKPEDANSTPIKA